MAKELQARYTSGQILYAVVLNSIGSAWNGSAFESIGNAGWTLYAIALAEQGTTGLYEGAFPAGITAAGSYGTLAFRQLGPAAAVTDPVVGTGSVAWSGSAVAVPVVPNAMGQTTVAANNDKTGYGLTAGEHAGIATDTQAGLTAQGYTAARSVQLDNLDAAVSTRSTYAGADTGGTTTLLARIPGTVQPQTGDAYARIGAGGAALTALGDTRLAHLDADVSTRSVYAGGPVASVVAPVTVGTNQDKTGYSVSSVADKTGYSLAAAGLDAVIVETSPGAINARQALALVMDAAPGGILSGAGTTSVTVKDPSGAHDRIVATVDFNGNRSAVTLTPPA